jgi:hypothetical protein
LTQFQVCLYIYMYIYIYIYIYIHIYIGICPVREELYSQCFDELIRQITINCAERGLLLLRVRDEVHI